MEANDPFSKCQTGDLVFFHGTSFTSYVIELSGQCPWSHVGMVVVNPETSALCLWEATNHPTTASAITITSDAWTRTPGPNPAGVRLVDLRERLAEEDRCGLMRLVQRTRFTAFELRIYSFIRRHAGMPYEPSVLTIIDSWWDWCGIGANPAQLDAYFCSELIVDTLRSVDAMDSVNGPGGQRNQPASEWTVRNVVELASASLPRELNPLVYLSYCNLVALTLISR